MDVYIVSANRQRNGTDCGVYAIANMVEFCLNYHEDIQLSSGKIGWEFGASGALRDHLLSCINSLKFTEFPKICKKISYDVHKDYIKIDCRSCFWSNLFQLKMIGCEKCNSWFHYNCASIFQDPSESFQYICPTCAARETRRARSTQLR